MPIRVAGDHFPHNYQIHGKVTVCYLAAHLRSRFLSTVALHDLQDFLTVAFQGSGWFHAEQYKAGIVFVTNSLTLRWRQLSI